MALSVEKVYSLQLANGHEWNIIATEGLAMWVDELASIMALNLSEVNGAPKLILTKSDIDKAKYEEPVYAFEQNIQESLPSSGWSMRSHRSASIQQYVQFWCHREVPDIIYWIGENENRQGEIMKMWHLTSFVCRKEQVSGGLPLHAGFIRRDGKGMLLVADGGVGKSTCCRRVPLPWDSPSDDQVLAIRDKHGKYVVHSFPTWSEYLWNRSKKTWNIGDYTPLSAVLFLQQAKNDKVIPIDKSTAAVSLCDSALQGRVMGNMGLNTEEKNESKKQLFNNACDLAASIPSYILEVSLHGKFWEEIEKAL